MNSSFKFFHLLSENRAASLSSFQLEPDIHYFLGQSKKELSRIYCSLNCLKKLSTHMNQIINACNLLSCILITTQVAFEIRQKLFWYLVSSCFYVMITHDGMQVVFFYAEKPIICFFRTFFEAPIVHFLDLKELFLFSTHFQSLG